MNDRVLAYFQRESAAMLAATPVEPMSIPVLGQRSDRKVARIFPPMVRDALVAASQLEKVREAGTSMVRIQAVDAAVRRARRECPHLFNNEKE